MQSYQRPHKLRAQFQRAVLTSDANHTSWGPRLPTFSWLGYISSLIICYNGSQKSGKCFTFTYWFMIEVLSWIQMKRCIEWGLEGSWMQELLSPWSWGMLLPLAHGCIHQYGSSSSPILYEFLWRLHYVNWSVINSISNPSLLQGGCMWACM